MTEMGRERTGSFEARIFRSLQTGAGIDVI